MFSTALGLTVKYSLSMDKRCTCTYKGKQKRVKKEIPTACFSLSNWDCYLAFSLYSELSAIIVIVILRIKAYIHLMYIRKDKDICLYIRICMQGMKCYRLMSL